MTIKNLTSVKNTEYTKHVRHVRRWTSHIYLTTFYYFADVRITATIRLYE